MTINKTSILDLLPTLPTTSGTRSIKACGCGCGSTTSREFAPGHDARLKGIVLRVVTGRVTFEQLSAICEEAQASGTMEAVARTLANPIRLKTWKIEVPAGFTFEAEQDVEQVG